MAHVQHEINSGSVAVQIQAISITGTMSGLTQKSCCVVVDIVSHLLKGIVETSRDPESHF